MLSKFKRSTTPFSEIWWWLIYISLVKNDKILRIPKSNYMVDRPNYFFVIRLDFQCTSTKLSRSRYNVRSFRATFCIRLIRTRLYLFWIDRICWLNIFCSNACWNCSKAQSNPGYIINCVSVVLSCGVYWLCLYWWFIGW